MTSQVHSDPVALHQAALAVFHRREERRRSVQRALDPFDFYSAIGAKKIVTPLDGGELFPISADVDGRQDLCPSFTVIDELGFIDSESSDVALFASGKRHLRRLLGSVRHGSTARARGSASGACGA